MSEYSKAQKENSRKHIEKAIFECLETTCWNELNVSMICRQAELSRKTFYRHFSSPDECIEKWFLRLEKEYLDSLDPDHPLDHYDLAQITQEFFTFWKPWQKSLKILCLSGFDLHKPFMESAGRIIQIRAGQDHDNLALFSSGGFYSLWIHWILQKEDGQMIPTYS